MLGSALALLPLAAVPALAEAATYYLRPNDALNDSVTESETPSSSDYIEASASARQARVGVETHSILGVSISSAAIWYNQVNSQPVEVKSSADASYVTTSSAGWHSVTESIASQSALDGLAIEFRTTGSSSPARQVRAAFLKIQTTGPKVYWGAWMDGSVYQETNPGVGTAPWDSTTWSPFEAHANKPVSIVHFGLPSPWRTAIGEFDTEPMKEKAGASNITWVWCPNTSYLGGTRLESLYPGNSYVDWTRMDGYDWGELQPFSEIFSGTYSEVTGETSTFPWEWPIESTTGSQAAFAEGISSPYFASDEFGSPEKLKAIRPLP